MSLYLCSEAIQRKEELLVRLKRGNFSFWNILKSKIILKFEKLALP